MKQFDEKQFIEIYREFAPHIFKYCYFRVNSKEDAEDLSSRVFTKTWDYLVKGEKVENMRAFLYRVAHNLVVDFYKSNSQKREKEMSINNFDGETVDIKDSVDIEGDLETKNTIQEIKDSLDLLNDDYKEIITMRYINDLSIEEIANATGMSLNNVSVKLHRATEKLKTIVS